MNVTITRFKFKAYSLENHEETFILHENEGPDFKTPDLCITWLDRT